MRLAVAFLAIFALLVTPAVGAVRLVVPPPIALTPETSTKEFWQGVKDGDVIVLGQGEYGGINLWNQSFPAKGLTIRATAATVHHSQFKTVSNVLIDGGTWLNDCAPNAPSCQNTALNLLSSDHITIKNADILGPFDVTPGRVVVVADGTGIGSRGSSFITVLNVTFEGLKSGLTLGSTTDVTARGNLFKNLRVDGIVMDTVQRAEIDHNVFTGTSLSGSGHPDGIQCYSRVGAEPTGDVNIHDNIILGSTQGISCFDHTAGGFDRLTVTNNLLVIDAPNAVSINNGRDLTITGNTVVTLPGSPKRAGINIHDNSYLDCSGNSMTAGGSGLNTGWPPLDNAAICRQ